MDQKSILDMSLDEFSERFCPEMKDVSEEEDVDTLHAYLRKIPRHVALEYLDKTFWSIKKPKRISTSYASRFLKLENARNPLSMTLEEYIDEYHPDIRQISNDETDDDHVPDWYLESLEPSEAHFLLDKMLGN